MDVEIIIGIVCIYIVYRIIKSILSVSEEPEEPEITVRVKVSGNESYRSYSGSYGRPSGKPAKWYGSGRKVAIGKYEIAGGLVYVGEVLLDSYKYDNDACLINPKLKVSASEPWEGGDEMGYWPSYGNIPEKCRGAYLQWLATGRSEPEAYIGYVFLFFYGLERRLFVDGQREGIADGERSAIVNEVVRLLGTYGDNRSFRGYATNFLAMEWVLYQKGAAIPDYIDFNDRYCSEPFQVFLAQNVVAGKPVSADLALQWTVLHPDSSLRTPARRCAKEFRALFTQRYTEKYGDGLVVKPNKTPLKLYYRAASPSFRGEMNIGTPDLPNPFILKGPLKKINALVEECTTDLEPYSRYLGRKGNVSTSLAALALLPRSLMVQAPGIERIKKLFAEVGAKGLGLISIQDLYNGIDEPMPLSLGKKEYENIAFLVEGLGYGLAPDVRHHGIKPNPEGKVVIFPDGHGVDFRPSREFRMMTTILRLGAIVSQIDQDLSPSEEETLKRLVTDNRELTKIEKDSLVAFLYWCLRNPLSSAGLKNQLAEVSSAEKLAISHVLISVAHADGYIDPKEVKQLEKFYTALGLDKTQVASDIHALSSAGGPVTVGVRDQEKAFSIPGQGEDGVAAKGFQLDQELIRIREEETRQVKGVLENIFSDSIEKQDPVEEKSVVCETTDTPLAKLDQAHQSLFNKLLTNETWKRPVFHETCNELGLMVDGAMEILNEWAFDHANAPLIDDGDPVYFDVSLAREIVDAECKYSKASPKRT